jgi:hypothetical protein
VIFANLNDFGCFVERHFAHRSAARAPTQRNGETFAIGLVRTDAGPRKKDGWRIRQGTIFLAKLNRRLLIECSPAAFRTELFLTSLGHQRPAVVPDKRPLVPGADFLQCCQIDSGVGGALALVGADRVPKLPSIRERFVGSNPLWSTKGLGGSLLMARKPSDLCPHDPAATVALRVVDSTT